MYYNDDICCLLFYCFCLKVEPKELRVHMAGSGSNMAAVGPIHITNLGPDAAFKLSIFVLQVSFALTEKSGFVAHPLTILKN
jgi:hypothetical protein